MARYTVYTLAGTDGMTTNGLDQAKEYQQRLRNDGVEAFITDRLEHLLLNVQNSTDPNEGLLWAKRAYDMAIHLRDNDEASRLSDVIASLERSCVSYNRGPFINI